YSHAFLFFLYLDVHHRDLHSFPTRRSSDLLSLEKLNHHDRRVRRTQKLFREAFLELIAEKEYSQITVTEIIKEADYNRATFYRQDRKSTRLNSSHVSISYAVFCLKKKKKNH